MFQKKEYLKAIEENYTSAISFNKEVTGDEPLPRSTNIARIAWAKDGRDWNLFVEFFGYSKRDGTVSDNTGYVYQTDYKTWQELVLGAETEDRPSTGKVFHEKIRNKVPFERVY